MGVMRMSFDVWMDDTPVAFVGFYYETLASELANIHIWSGLEDLLGDESMYWVFGYANAVCSVTRSTLILDNNHMS